MEIVTLRVTKCPSRKKKFVEVKVKNLWRLQVFQEI